MSNSSLDSHRRSLSKKKRILKTILDSEIELAPWEIARRTGINHSTVRDHVRSLLKEGKVIQPYKGTYCSKITHGMIFVPLRVHNVIVTTEAPWLDFSDDVVEFTGDVKVRIQFGLQRHKITGRISCDAGMDKNAISFALSRFYDLVNERSGRVLDEVTVKTFEINRDIQGVRLDGVKCYTKKGLFGMIERIYQKEEDVVRYENKITKAMTVDEFNALLMGGVGTYNMQQGVFALSQKIEKLTDAIKFSNEQTRTQIRLMKALLDKFERS